MNHDWQGCRPVLLQTWDDQTAAERAKTAAAQEALDKVWATLSDAEKRGFHDFCCNNARDVHATEAMAKVTRMVEQAMAVN